MKLRFTVVSVGLLGALGCFATGAEEKIIVISDIVNWNHPAKDVFKKWNIKLKKVELTKNRIFPIFYLDDFPFDPEMGRDNAEHMAKLEAELFFANGKHDYALEISPDEIRVTVTYDSTTDTLAEAIDQHRSEGK